MDNFTRQNEVVALWLSTTMISREKLSFSAMDKLLVKMKWIFALWLYNNFDLARKIVFSENTL